MVNKKVDYSAYEVKVYEKVSETNEDTLKKMYALINSAFDIESAMFKKGDRLENMDDLTSRFADEEKENTTKIRFFTFYDQGKMVALVWTHVIDGDGSVQSVHAAEEDKKENETQQKEDHKETVDQSLYFGMLSVAKTHQGKGLGTYIMNYLEKVAKSESIGYLAMKTIDIRDELTTYYRNRGFTMVSVLDWPKVYESMVWRPIKFLCWHKKI